jgi:hypothetical protein
MASWMLMAIVVAGWLLVPFGCKKEAPNPVTPTPPAILVTINGTVLKPDDRSGSFVAFAGATVILDSATASSKVQVTDNMGSFSFAQVTEGKHHLRVSHPGAPVLDTLVIATTDPMVLCVEVYRYPLTGTVQALDTASGLLVPLPGVTVSLDHGPQNAYVQLTDNAGNFSFARVTAGMHYLRVSDPSILTLDTQVVVLATTGTLSFTVRELPLTEVFPLAMGGKWVYEYAHLHYYDDGFIYRYFTWEKGTVTFTVLGVSDAGLQRTWIIHEEDDLIQSDTTWKYSEAYYTKPEVAIRQDLTFSMHETNSGVHPITTDSCSMLWRIPSEYDLHVKAFGGQAFVLSRYVVAEDSVVYFERPLPYYALVSRVLLRDVGLTRCQLAFGAGNMTKTYDSFWGNLRAYTPGQLSGVSQHSRYTRPRLNRTR